MQLRGGRPIKAWIGEGDSRVPVEQGAIDQLERTARLPFIHSHVAAMPDIHVGIGATVGSVVATRGAIVPAAVGVDIGCGMVAQPLGIVASDLPDNLGSMRTAIECMVPHGRTDNGDANDRGSWRGELAERVVGAYTALAQEWDDLVRQFPKIRHRGPLDHLGTLGTGNHFIELCLDETDHVWLMLHSGSRGPGNAIGRYFIERAQEECARYFVKLEDPNLAYLPEGTPLFDAYWRALKWAQDFAFISRKVMMSLAESAVSYSLGTLVGGAAVAGITAVNCHHNYVAREHHFGENVLVTRKGAVRARSGDLGIIPSNMGGQYGSYIVRGLGNPDSFHSCSHGAGRVMSRTEARRRFTVDDHVAATAGVECRKDESVLDETPGAYKPMDAVMAAQDDLVEVVHELRTILSVKG